MIILLRKIKRAIEPILDLKKLFLSIPRYGLYIREYYQFKLLNKQQHNNAPICNIPIKELYPCLHDKTTETQFDHHYIYLNAWAFRKIVTEKPAQHVDVGSQLSFISLLSSVVPVTFIDLRPAKINLPGLEGKKGTILSLPYLDCSIQSMSSLHVIEHIGLGRYGDPIDPSGTANAINELARVISPGGKLYIGVPISSFERIRFNADRIFNPLSIIEAFSKTGLQLNEFSYVDDHANTHYMVSPNQLAADCKYGCGMFIFSKP